jgi:hypothetical protein
MYLAVKKTVFSIFGATQEGKKKEGGMRKGHE